jgi:predicted nuclease with TOPRIM domain|tara:strand:- start:1008 stop:1244 length:237 start_codon:yes stop_codon:yes gene_type:complete
VVTDQTKEIDRLTEENNNLRTINKGHKDLNGELQTKLSKKEQEVVALYENVKLKDKIISRLKDRIQDIIKQLVQLCRT